MQSDGITHEDSYRVFVPIGEEDELMKSVEVDENGDYIVQGVMTAEDKDEEDDSITAEGMDCSYFLEKGWIKYEHGNSPNQFIGEPIEVKVGQFEHPTRHNMVKGIFVKGRLFAKRELAVQAINAIKDLQKSHTKRKMGWSIEGNVKERDRKTGKIVKSILRNVVLTMNPVNTMTWAELSKSFAKNHELTIDMEMDKSMDIAGASAITPQSIEGYTAKSEDEDEQSKWIKLFRAFVKANVLSKSLREKFVTSSASVVGMTAYTFALQQMLDNEEAYKFASYISGKQEVLKSIFRTNFGGELMQKSLSELLDLDLEELQKSLNNENDSENEELVKSTDKETSEEDKNEEDEEDSKEEDDKEEDDKEEDDKEEDDDKPFAKKSLQTDFAKSLASNAENKDAFEVSDFLTNLVDEVGYSIDGFAKSMSLNAKNQGAIVKSLVSFGDLVKSLVEKMEDLKSDNEDLKKSLNEVLAQPVGRRSAVSTREIATVQKSADTKNALNRIQISDILMKSFEAGEITGMTVSRFEAGNTVDSLNLPQSVLTKLGL